MCVSCLAVFSLLIPPFLLTWSCYEANSRALVPQKASFVITGKASLPIPVHKAEKRLRHSIYPHKLGWMISSCFQNKTVLNVY